MAPNSVATLKKAIAEFSIKIKVRKDKLTKISLLRVLVGP